jgi:hypothetical protein
MHLAQACQQCIDAGKTQQFTWQNLNWLCMPIKTQHVYLIGLQSNLKPSQLLQRLNTWQFVNIHCAYIQQNLYVYCLLKQSNIKLIEDSILLLKQLS